MTRRRIIELGTTWALSRRTTRRHFLLHPDEARQMEQCYWYCLGYAAELDGVAVHAGCLMSTHSHEVVTDTRGELPRFLQTFHRLLALTTKAFGKWPEEVFNKRSSGAHALLTSEATIEALAYLISNPVEAGAGPLCQGLARRSHPGEGPRDPSHPGAPSCTLLRPQKPSLARGDRAPAADARSA